ncbi:sigma-70 family RNA polymerase sigma factor [Chloroflexus sp.]|uniref:RNA polymerase sigma factor n=1 Tax=Chloroflexus sp. TaxID=1904827 RepID=UPI002ACD2F55|nr:sigma-70 family RNA polymerase sigma factor [Chloroflexus sp.]
MYSDAKVLKATWLDIARRNQWALIDNVDAWISSVQAHYPEIGTDIQPSTLLLRAYSARLYQGCMYREERAAWEVWIYCYRAALRQSDSRENVEDVVQETIALVIEKLSQVRHPESFLPWVLTILRSVSRTFLQARRKGNVPLGAIEVTSERLIDPMQQPAEETEQKILKERMLSLLGQLKASEREILIRQLLFDERIGDIARDLGLDAAYVRVMKHRALHRLRSMLGAELGLENRSL